MLPYLIIFSIVALVLFFVLKTKCSDNCKIDTNEVAPTNEENLKKVEVEKDKKTVKKAKKATKKSAKKKTNKKSPPPPEKTR